MRGWSLGTSGCRRSVDQLASNVELVVNLQTVREIGPERRASIVTTPTR